MDLQQLHHRTGVELRRLRYCLDHDLVPDLYIHGTTDQAGRPRKFAEDVGFAIVCAAKLLELGLPHQRIRGFLAGLLSVKLQASVHNKPPISALGAVLERPAPALAHLGDGINIRIDVDEYGYSSGWVDPRNPAKLDKDYRPVVIVTLDIGQIRDQVFQCGGD